MFTNNKLYLLSLVLVVNAIVYAGWYVDADGNYNVDDGGEYIIDSLFDNNVEVDRYAQPNPGTSVELVSSGRIEGSFRGWGDSDITVSGGTLTWFLGGTNNARITMTGGTVEQDLYTFLYSEAFVSGGHIVGEVFVKDDSQVTISGGIVDTIWIGQIAHTNILSSHALVTIDGRNFSFDNQPATYGYYGWEDFPAYTDWRGTIYHGTTLAGTLFNDDFINAEIRIYSEDAQLLLVPKPPCDNSLAIVYDRDGNIYVANTDGSNETQLTNESNSDIMPSISPDGSTIAFSRDSDLYLMNHDGTNQRLLVSKSDVGNNNVHNSDWTLDGEWIYFDAVSGCCSGGLYKVAPDGTGLTQVKSGYIHETGIRDNLGDRVIFHQRRNSLSYSSNVRITNLDGGNEEHVTGGGPSESSAIFGTCWSPDGQRFAYNYGHQHIMVASYPAPYNPIEVKTFGSWKSHSLEWLNNDTLIWIDASDSGPMHTINVDTLVEGDLGIDGHYPYVGQICEPPVIEVAVDIKPGSCPNPLNVKSKGVLPVAILGTADVNVIDIDPTSIAFSIGDVNVGAIRRSYEDVAGPILDTNDCNCVAGGPDGFLDLTLKFKTQEIVEALGDVNDGDVLTLELTGVLFGERPIEGADCILIRGKHKPINPADINKDGVVNAVDFAIFAQNWLQSSIVEE